MSSEPTESLKEYSLADVSKHTSSDDCWLAINGKVYNVSDYADEHPGGPELLRERAGKDATTDFYDTGHSKLAKKTLKKFLIGQLKDGEGERIGEGESSSSSGANYFAYLVPVVILVAGLVFRFYMFEGEEM